jgi:thiosulfate/3-mercaptopyruvate sulfurtransferase
METYRHPEAIADTEWLEAHLHDPSLRVIDCTVHLVYEGVPPGVPYIVKSGREDFEREHIPGADFIDLQAELSENDSPYSFTLPTAAHFSTAMERHGVGDDTRVILYSATHPMWATRVWWMLRAFGFDRAAVLDGGFRKWRAEGRAVSTVAPGMAPRVKFTAKRRSALFTDKHEVLEAIGAAGICTINALPSDLYVGQSDRYGRPGRIPGSVNLPTASLLDPPAGTFKSAPDLDALFSSTCPQKKTDRIIVYCGGGIAATLDAFLMHQLGYENLAIYDNSMSEWAKDESLPMEVG